MTADITELDMSNNANAMTHSHCDYSKASIAPFMGCSLLLGKKEH